MIINFFTTDHFNQYKDSLNNHIVINTINGDFFLKLFIDNIQNHIDSIILLLGEVVMICIDFCILFLFSSALHGLPV